MNRIPLVVFGIQQQWVVPPRRDKTGSRTWPGVEAGGRLSTAFELLTYLTSWQKTNPGPAYGPLFQSALGATPAEYYLAAQSRRRWMARISCSRPRTA